MMKNMVRQIVFHIEKIEHKHRHVRKDDFTKHQIGVLTYAENIRRNLYGAIREKRRETSTHSGQRTDSAFCEPQTLYCSNLLIDSSI